MFRSLREINTLLRHLRKDIDSVFAKLSPAAQFQLRTDWAALPHSLNGLGELRDFAERLYLLLNSHPVLQQSLPASPNPASTATNESTITRGVLPKQDDITEPIVFPNSVVRAEEIKEAEAWIASVAQALDQQAGLSPSA